MRRLISFIGGAAVARSFPWPLAARGQQDGWVRRIGYSAVGDEAGRFIQARQGAVRQGLAKLGWIDGCNVWFRYFGRDTNRLCAHSDELVRLAPDLIIVVSGPAAQAPLQRIRAIPNIFTPVGDPLAIGLMKNIFGPEGNATGMTGHYRSLGGKWLELLMEAAPRTVRVALASLCRSRCSAAQTR